ncbi:MAG: hypothetical protein VXY89_13905, partial [SAR324 cluster bacterium]|nr:hypothetical protein [SAR324 cluster bacterium]
MSSKWILSILMAAVVGWTQVGCMLPEEGTIVYDQGYPNLPEDVDTGSSGGVTPGSPSVSGGDGSGSGSSGGDGSGGG